MIQKLRIKFVCVNMLIVTMMMCIILVAVYHFTSVNLEQDSISMMQSIAVSPSQRSLPGTRGNSLDLNLPYFSLELGKNGEIIQAEGGFFDLSDMEMLEEVLNIVRSGSESVGVLPEYNLRYCETYTPTGHFIVFADMSSEQNTLRNLMKNGILIGLASLVVFLFLSILLSRWAIKPVETAWKQQRQFVADASHELKTPLTVIITNAAMLQEVEQAQGTVNPFSSNIVTMSAQMKELIESLLSLARVDAGLPKSEMTHLDLSDLIEDTILPFEALFYENHLEISTQIEPGLFVVGNPSRLRQVSEIFLDNARKYATPHSTVTISLRRVSGRYCQLTVSNPSDPMDKQELEHIFKRFYRADSAHTRDGSYGLGLPIAEGIVNEHHGKIWAEAENGITSFHVRLKLAAIHN